jgi:hypothetical protein
MAHTPRKNSAHATLEINLSDGHLCELWVSKIAAVLKPEVMSLDIFFVSGGEKINPAALLSLRNTLMLIPEAVRIRTIATSSLSPFACVAWFLGDERWMARDARLWIPRLPEPLLRGHARTEPPEKRDVLLTHLPASAADEGREGSEWAGDDAVQSLLRRMSSEENSLPDVHAGEGASETDCGCDRCRLYTELRTLASLTNEWFPCWEYSGTGISAQTLVELRVIRPEWILGGENSRRSKARHIAPPPPVAFDNSNCPASPKTEKDNGAVTIPPHKVSPPVPPASQA